MALRSPIVSVLGHVDHGKSSVLDAIRGSNIIATEAGKITQAIGASIVPLHIIQQRCGKLMEGKSFSIPGLLFIDTPGHAAFTNLRKRGGNLADIAVLVVDINEGFKPQTREAIEILKTYKTPFVIAANKIDLISGYHKKTSLILQDIQQQRPEWITAFEMKLYELVGKLHDEFGIQGERFDRIESFTNQVAIIPTSAANGQGVNELLMVLTGLAQKYLEEHLNLNVEGPGKGTILEVKETTGFGATVDVILYDGVIKKNDTIVIGGVDTPLITKVRAILEPNPLHELRDKKTKYRNVNEATAATGIKVAAPDLDKAIAGMPLRVAIDADAVAKEVQAEVREVLIQTDKDGVIIKADTLGSLEALSVLLREKEIPIRKASVGQITKKDIADAESNYENNPSYAVVLGFNIPAVPGTENAAVITSDVIYKLIDNLEEWHETIQSRKHEEQLSTITRPCKIEILANCIFRQNNPCVAGSEVLQGRLKVGMPLMNHQGKRLTIVKSIQRNKETINEAQRGEQVAVSMPDVTAGRQLNEHDVLYSFMDQETFRALKELKDSLDPDEKACLKEIARIMREENPLWGI